MSDPGHVMFEFSERMLFDPKHPIVKALVPPGAHALAFVTLQDGVAITYRTAEGLTEQRKWIVSSTTRWPD